MFSGVEMKQYDYIDTTRLSSPTCEQLGIPGDDHRHIGDIQNTSVPIDNKRYEIVTKVKADPFSPYSMIPLPCPFGSVFDPSCIRRRNERERDRVRCVNDGYLKLKEHLPLDNRDKRISKVETLRGAIQYIKHLKSLLDNAQKQSINGSHDGNAIYTTFESECYNKTDSQCNKENNTADTSVSKCSPDVTIEAMSSFPVDESRTRGRYTALKAHKTMRTN